MSYCAICYEEDLPGNPVVNTCYKCSIETHKPCYLNNFSFNIVKILAFKTILIPPINNLFTWAINPIWPKESTIYNTGISNALVSHTNADALDDTFVITQQEEENDQYKIIKNSNLVYISGKCIQCGETVTYQSKLKTISPIKISDNIPVLLDPQYKFLQIFNRLIYLAFVESIRQSFKVVPKIRSILPYLYIFRNIIDSSMSNTSIADIFEYKMIYDSASQPISIFLLYFTLKAIYLPETFTFSTIIKISAILMERIGPLIYEYLFNPIYRKWAIEIYGDISTNNLTYGNQYDNTFFNLDRKPIDYRNYILSYIIPIRPNKGEEYNDDRPMKIKYKIIDRSRSFDYFVLVWTGTTFGSKFLSKCKPLIKMIYKTCNKFNDYIATPIPIEVDTFLELCGYKLVVGCKTLLDFFVAYFEYKSLKQSYIVDIHTVD